MELKFTQADADSPERIAVATLAKGMEDFEILNGRLPKNWDELSTVVLLDDLNKTVVGRQSYPIQSHYQFVEKGATLPGSPQTQLLMIRVTPLWANVHSDDQSIQNQKRYAIFKAENGRVGDVVMPEKEVQKMLADANLTITPKAGLPAVESDKKSDDKASTVTSQAILSKNPLPSASPQSKEKSPTIAEEKEVKQLPVAWIIGGVILLAALIAAVMMRRKR